MTYHTDVQTRFVLPYTCASSVCVGRPSVKCCILNDRLALGRDIGESMMACIAASCPQCSGTSLNYKQHLKGLHHILISSA